MQHFRCTREQRVLLVAKSADLTRDGGLVFFDAGKRTTATLERHVLIGDLPAAVFRSSEGDFLLISYDGDRDEMIVMSRMTAAALAAFTQKEGVFWTLPQ